MLDEAKLTCRAMDPIYEAELCRLIRAGIREIHTRGVNFDGEFTYETETDKKTGLPMVSSWSSTVKDDWVRTAVLAYVKAHFPNTEDKAAAMAAYEATLDKLMHTTGYTDWG